MKRIKKFIMFLILFLLLYFFVDYVVNNMIDRNYEELTDISQDLGQVYTIDIIKANKDISGGKLELNITRNLNVEDAKYIKIDFYNNKDECIGSRYIDPTSLNVGDNKSIQIDFSYKDVERCSITTAKELPENTFKEFNKGYLGIFVIIGLITLCYVL